MDKIKVWFNANGMPEADEGDGVKISSMIIVVRGGDPVSYSDKMLHINSKSLVGGGNTVLSIPTNSISIVVYPFVDEEEVTKEDV